MSISAGFCDLRQVIERRGTRAEARMIIDAVAREVDAALKRAERERDELKAHPPVMLDTEREAALHTRLSRARGLLERFDFASTRWETFVYHEKTEGDPEKLADDIRAFLTDEEGEP